MAIAEAMVELEGVLSELVPAVARLSALLVDQRQAVATGDLARLLSLTTEQEEAAARLAHLDQRRARLQADLEAALGVRGLCALAEAAIASDTRREEFLAITRELLRATVALHEEHERATALLGAAIEVCLRTRGYLHRVAGQAPPYSAAVGYSPPPQAPLPGGP